MPIEFPCPHCGKRMRTPDASAGKKGRCPHCGGVAKIPESSAAGSSTASSAARKPAAPKPSASGGSQAARPAADGKIQFSCAQCGHAVRVPASFAGKKGKCPHCQAVNQIPQASSASSATTSASPPASSPAKSSSAAAGQPIKFPCPQCNRQVKTPAAAAGKKGKCPHCAAVIQIPTTSSPSVVEASPDELTPLPDDGGLTPMPATDTNDPFGLGSPAGATADPFGLGGDLGSAGNDPLGLGGGGAADPFADLGQPGQLGDAYGGPAAAANPYATPSISTTTKKKRGGGGGKRKGLPWDREEEGGFFGTVKLVLGSPTDAFTRMRVTGGVGRPLMFAVLGNLVGALFTALYQVLAVGAMAVMLLGSDSPNSGEALGGILLQTGAQIFGNVAGSVAGAAVGTFISAGFLHLILMMFGGANGTYETTFRAVAYTSGSLAFFLIIPCVGGIVVAFAYPVYMIIGASRAHETDGWRAACAVLFPYVLCCVSVIFLIITIFGVAGLAAAGAGGG